MPLVRPKSLCKLRETIKPKARRTNGKSMETIAADINRTLKGWYEYFKNVKASQLGEIDGWIRMRMRSILRKRNRRKGRGRGRYHQRWPNRYFAKLGLFCLLDTRKMEIASLRKGANHWLESRVREIRSHGSEVGTGQANAPFLPLSNESHSLVIFICEIRRRVEA